MFRRVPLTVHWVRHGEVTSHRGDIPVTENGLLQAEEAGQKLGRELDLDEVVHFLYGPTRRARETVEAIRSGAAASLDDEENRRAELLAPVEEWALRNPDLYVAGYRVELVSSPEALAEQIPDSGLGPEELLRHPFFRVFWAAPDPVKYYVDHPDPPGEDASTVARRLLTFAASLPDATSRRPRRYVCVTHSPVLRAFLLRYLVDRDPGEPDFLEFVDLTFSPEDRPTVHFRERSSTVTPTDAGDTHR